MFRPLGASPMIRHLGAEPAEERRGVGRRGAVGAIERDLQAVERQWRWQAVGERLKVVGAELGLRLECGRGGLLRCRGRSRQRLLEAPLVPLPPFVAGSVEQLDAVVLMRVVAGGNGNAGRGAELAHQPGYARCRHHAAVPHTGPTGGQTLGQPGAQGRCRLAGIARQHHHRALLGGGQDPRQLAAERRDRGPIQWVDTGAAAHAVGAEQPFAQEFVLRCTKTAKRSDVRCIGRWPAGAFRMAPSCCRRPSGSRAPPARSPPPAARSGCWRRVRRPGPAGRSRGRGR